MNATGCDHNVVNTEGESVCVKCGLVESYSNIDESSTGGSSPAPNLFLSQAVGTGGEIPAGSGTDAARRFFKGGLSPQKSLSCLSNTCQKLRLRRHVELDAWRLFTSISKKMPGKVAEHACVAIFYACRRSGTPAPASDIIDAVKTCFGRKGMPTMAKMIYRHMDVIEYDGTRENEGRYYFNVALMGRTADLDMSESAFAKCKLTAWVLFTGMYDWIDNYGSRAKMSVDRAFGLSAWSGGKAR